MMLTLTTPKVNAIVVITIIIRIMLYPLKHFTTKQNFKQFIEEI